MTLLVATSVAVFVCAQAKAALPTSIKIISIGPYHCTSDTFEGDSHSMRADTNVNFDTVDWYVNDSFVRTDNGPSTTSVFSHDYPALGSTTGAAVVVKAVATDAAGNTDTDQATINVWTKSETVAITSQTNDQDYIDAAISNIAVQTDVGFYRVDWSIDGGSPISDNGPDLESQIMIRLLNRSARQNRHVHGDPLRRQRGRRSCRRRGSDDQDHCLENNTDRF